MASQQTGLFRFKKGYFVAFLLFIASLVIRICFFWKKVLYLLANYVPQFFIAMKKVSFNVQKWTVRVLVAVGALLGISACCHTKKVVEEDNNNYFDNNNNNTPQIHALKYGPLVDIYRDTPVLNSIIERIDENGNVVYDTIVSPETPREKPKLKPLNIEDE